MPKVLHTFVCVEGWNERPDASGNTPDGSLRDFAKERLQRMKDHLDWIEVRGILRQIAQACTDCLDGLLHTKDLMGGKVFNHHNVSALERRGC
jgi:hypothetical protein